jgi:hypothetical protein
MPVAMLIILDGRAAHPLRVSHRSGHTVAPRVDRLVQGRVIVTTAPPKLRRVSLDAPRQLTRACLMTGENPGTLRHATAYCSHLGPTSDRGVMMRARCRRTYGRTVYTKC